MLSSTGLEGHERSVEFVQKHNVVLRICLGSFYLKVHAAYRFRFLSAGRTNRVSVCLSVCVRVLISVAQITAATR